MNERGNLQDNNEDSSEQSRKGSIHQEEEEELKNNENEAEREEQEQEEHEEEEDESDSKNEKRGLSNTDYEKGTHDLISFEYSRNVIGPQVQDLIEFDFFSENSKQFNSAQTKLINIDHNAANKEIFESGLNANSSQNHEQATNISGEENNKHQTNSEPNSKLQISTEEKSKNQSGSPICQISLAFNSTPSNKLINILVPKYEDLEPEALLAELSKTIGLIKDLIKSKSLKSRVEEEGEDFKRITEYIFKDALHTIKFRGGLELYRIYNLELWQNFKIWHGFSNRVGLTLLKIKGKSSEDAIEDILLSSDFKYGSPEPSCEYISLKSPNAIAEFIIREELGDSEEKFKRGVFLCLYFHDSVKGDEEPSELDISLSSPIYPLFFLLF